MGESNHGVTIIGWDDNYPKENFLEEHQPPEDGAWLIKNSWRSEEEEFPVYGRGNWGLENEEGVHTGYFWISYYDQSIIDPESLVLDIALAPQSIDQYDYMQVDSLYSQTFAESVSMANVFRADHSKILSAVSCITAADGTAKEEIKEGPNASVNEGTWEMSDPAKIVYTLNDIETEMEYFLFDDTLFRDFKEESPDAPYPYLRFIYVRAESEEEGPAPEEPDAEEQPAAQSETQAAEQEDNPGDLIADGQIFTGATMYLYAPEGGGYYFYGNDGSTWVTEAYFDEFPVGSNGLDD